MRANVPKVMLDLQRVTSAGSLTISYVGCHSGVGWNAISIFQNYLEKEFTAKGLYYTVNLLFWVGSSSFDLRRYHLDCWRSEA
jgi:hypothetical protein